MRSNERTGYAPWLRLALLLAAITLMLGAVVQPAHAQVQWPQVLPLPDGFRPEGIERGRGTSFYVGSLNGGAIYRGDLRTGEGEVIFAGGVGPVTGLEVDVRTNYLFAAGAGTGQAHVFDAATGELLQTYQLTTASPTFINDAVVTRDAVYFTDSNQAFLYKLPLGPGGELPDESEVEQIPLTGDYQLQAGFNANGIDAPPNGKVLVIVQSNTGKLFAVDPDTGVTEEIDLNGGSVPNGDGILLDGKRLYVVQNQNNQIAVVELNLRTLSGEIVDTISDPAFDVPTTITEFGPWLYAVNARFSTPPTPDTEYGVVRVAK